MILIVTGFIRVAAGSTPVAESAGYTIEPELSGLTGLASCSSRCARSRPDVPR